ncbi:hypothetical protein OUZ56_012805 [Daphnia magna]|uniref:Uncharacterized protein n=1 Tax=Daphnia magna TaxID=35525 RepID=A0ABQ9Z442_9CRUS|nr:hypothetical protein OUZ56_012805 [Daphnia magna]
MPPNYTAKKISSQEELLEYMKEVGGTIVLGKDIESMFPPSSEVLKIDIIEEPKDLKTILPSCDVEVPKNAVNDDLFLPVNGEYPNFQTVSQYLEEFLEEKQKQIDAAFAEDEDEEIDLQQLEMRVKSLRGLLYLENLGAEVITIRAYKARNRCESILGVLHNSPHSREHYVNVAEFIEKRLDLIVGDGKPRDRNFLLEVLFPESLNFAIMDLLNVEYETASEIRRKGENGPKDAKWIEEDELDLSGRIPGYPVEANNTSVPLMPICSIDDHYASPWENVSV